MKKVTTLLLLILCIMELAAQEKFSNPDLISLIKTERAFSNMAQEKNIREAFLTYTNDSSFGFDNGIVLIKQRWEQRKADTAVLWWEPNFVDISSSGDFGVSTGPWEYKTGKNSPVKAQGHFFTVWLKQPDNHWIVGIDQGISYSTSIHQIPVFTSKYPLVNCFPTGENLSEIQTVEKNFIQMYVTDNFKAYIEYLMDDALLLYSGYQPFYNKQVIIEFLTKNPNPVKFIPLGIKISSSGDMAAAYGIGEINNRENMNKKAGWVRIWKKVNCTEWKLSVEVISI